MAGIDREELRQLVRQALKETLASGASGASPSASSLFDDMRVALQGNKPAKLPVSIANGGDLDRFAGAILRAAADPDLKAAIASGAICFEIEKSGSVRSAHATDSAPSSGVATFEKGVLSETRVVELSRKGRSIHLGKGVVVTPLAREKARQLKIELVRQKP